MICYLEIEHLYVEYDLDEHIVITNVQMTHPADREDTKRWIDITDHLTIGQMDQLIMQAEEELRSDDADRGDWLYDQRKDARLEER